MSGIVLLALASMLASIIIAEASRGDAGAINVAGSLRMQSYRLATYLQTEPLDQRRLTSYISSFEQALEGRALRGPVPAQAADSLRQSYQRVHDVWHQRMRPAVVLAQTEPAEAREAYLRYVDSFVEEVDAMVRLLQQRAESKIQLLRLIQGFALFMTLVLVFYSMYKLASGLLPPLQDLVRVADRARRGDFSGRTSYRRNDELGLLSHTFNQMAEDLSHMYRDLEQRVEEKTAALQRSNQALQLLYQTARQLSRDPSTNPSYRDMLTRMEKVLGNSRITLCLSTNDATQAYQSVSSSREPRPEFCQAPDCAPCFQGERSGHDGTVRVPIQDAGRQFGVLLVEHPPGAAPEPWQMELLETVADHIATAMCLAQQNAQERRLALMDERAVIARELHDSLAQALSYLKIQVSRLQVMLKQGAERSAQEAVLGELREGLNSAYRQLRELLNTFRLKMNEAGLEPALRTTVAEFAERGQLQISLDYQLSHCPLSPNEEIHTLQVVREGLANILHHANATHAEVCLRTTESGDVEAEIRDNGIGIPDNWQRSHHYGITIMQERAESLGGSLKFRRLGEGGTEVRLSFVPQINRPNNPNDLLVPSDDH